MGMAGQCVLDTLTSKVLFVGKILPDTTTMGSDGRRVVVAAVVLTLDFVYTCAEAINQPNTETYASEKKRELVLFVDNNSLKFL